MARPIKRTRGRPPGSRNKSSGQWFNSAAARSRLGQIDRDIERLRLERSLLVQVLGGANFASLLGAGRRGRRARDGRPSMLDLLQRIISEGPADKGWTVGELRDELVKIDPTRAHLTNASALISSALVQALRAKTPRFVGTKGGRGHAREYRLNTAQLA